MELAQANKHDEATAPDAATPEKCKADKDTTDADTSKNVDANAMAPGPAVPFGPVPVPVLATELPTGKTFMPATRGTQGLTVDTQAGIVGTALNLSDAVGPALHPRLGTAGELEISGTGAGPTPIGHGLAPTPLATAPLPPTQTQAAAISARVGEHGWDQGLGDKLVWMASQKLQVAELRLNPADLGPLKITITLDQNQASAQFFSAHASVRDAIESAMPRLREMLADSGITLGQASVGTETFREQAQQQSDTRHGPTFTPVSNMSNVTMGERLLQHARGLVDTFA